MCTEWKGDRELAGRQVGREGQGKKSREERETRARRGGGRGGGRVGGDGGRWSKLSRINNK